MRRNFSILWVLLLLVVLESACRKRQVAVPLPSPPTSAGKGSATTSAESTAPGAEPAQAPAQLEQPPALPPTPTGAPTPPPTANPADTTRYQVNKPPVPASKKPPRTATGAAPPAVQGPTAPAPAAPATPPRLGDILTPDQQREYNAAIDQSLSRAQNSLGSIGNRQLTKEQQGLLDQIRNFIQQAQETRKSDLQGAKSLAERADVLAGDLATSFR